MEVPGTSLGSGELGLLVARAQSPGRPGRLRAAQPAGAWGAAAGQACPCPGGKKQEGHVFPLRQVTGGLEGGQLRFVESD